MSQDGFARGYDAHRRDQARMGLRLTPAERLRWLEETVEKLGRWRGLARRVTPSPPRAKDETTNNR
jgi:hypothetical protein